jgi:hypothetical protein
MIEAAQTHKKVECHAIIAGIELLSEEASCLVSAPSVAEVGANERIDELGREGTWIKDGLGTHECESQHCLS